MSSSLPRRPAIALGVALATVGALATPVAPPASADPAAAQVATIAQIQGKAHRSPLEGRQVREVTGVVTAVSNTGFYLQSTKPDHDPATSEAVFVYTRTKPTVAVGDGVSLDATVSEFRPGGASGLTNLTTTQLGSATIRVTGTGRPLPAPVVLGKDRIAPAQSVRSDAPGDVETSSRFDVRRNGLDFYESLEGMRVGVADAVAVGPSNSFGELPVVPRRFVLAARTNAGGVGYADYRLPNTQRLILDDPLLPAGSLPDTNTGDRLPGVSVGVLDYSFGNSKLLLTQVPAHRSGGVQRETTRAPQRSELAVATFNVENLAPSDPATKYAKLAQQISTNLRAPDVLALEEVQDNSGSKDDGVVDSGTTVRKLVDAIKAAGGPSYQARWIDPQDKKDGGQPGGNIRQVFLYRTDRGVRFVDRPGGSATEGTQVAGSGAATRLTASPGRIDPGNAAWDDSRKPLAGEFRFRGASYFVVANHFASKGGDQPLFGRYQPPTRSSETQRHAQAGVVRAFADRLLAADPKARLVVLGDINDFEFSRTADILVGRGRTALTDLPRTAPLRERYSYVFDGNSQILDHILISPELAGTWWWPLSHRYSHDIVHTNSNFHDQDSDHDPQIVRLRAAR